VSSSPLRNRGAAFRLCDRWVDRAPLKIGISAQIQLCSIPISFYGPNIIANRRQISRQAMEQQIKTGAFYSKDDPHLTERQRQAEQLPTDSTTDRTDSNHPNLVQLVARTKPAVVLLDVATGNGIKSGTGFFISRDGYLVTRRIWSPARLKELQHRLERSKEAVRVYLRALIQRGGARVQFRALHGCVATL
jgi:hypothetical protein